MKMIMKMTLLLCCLTSLGAYAAENVARVIILKQKGKEKVKVKAPDGKVTGIKKGAWIKEGSIVQTPAKSFVKLLFIDKSQMSLGPKSQMVINSFPKKKAGIITLMKGQLRSKVTKNYMDMDDKEKSKLYVRTKTAAMGVRGTDFQVNFNPINNNTALVTFSGAVSMAQVNAALKDLKSRGALERVVSSDKAVLVKKGQYSGTMPGKTKRATTPVKISPAQLNSLKGNDGSKAVEKEDKPKAKQAKAPKKQFRSPIPPGVDSKAFSNVTNMEKQMESTVGTDMAKAVAKEAKIEAPADNFGPAGNKQAFDAAPPPEGMVNNVTGEIAPPAGGFIDLNTAQYIPPPEGSQYDPVAEVYIPPSNMGTFDMDSGDYVAPNNMELKADGTFTVVETKVAAENNPEASRGPASKEGKAGDDLLGGAGPGPGPEGEGQFGPGPDGKVPGEEGPVMAIAIDKPITAGENYSDPSAFGGALPGGGGFQKGGYRGPAAEGPGGEFYSETDYSELIDEIYSEQEAAKEEFLENQNLPDNFTKLRINLQSQ